MKKEICFVGLLYIFLLTTFFLYVLDLSCEFFPIYVMFAAYFLVLLTAWLAIIFVKSRKRHETSKRRCVSIDSDTMKTNLYFLI